MRLLALLLLLFSPLPAAADTVRVAVAANFKTTAVALSSQFSQETDHQVILSSASTGTLTTQIMHGAPFDIFLAANTSSPALLASTDQGSSTPICYAIGRLALVGGNGKLTQLANPSLSLAIANPRTAPYGEAAEQVLTNPAFAAGNKRKLLRGNNVIQALQFWRVGAADLALLPQALATEDGTLVPADWHQPIEQHALLLRPGQDNPAALSYLQWLQTKAAQALIAGAGYEFCP